MSISDNLQPKEHYPFLDGLRAVSILWVITHHIFILFNPSVLAGPAFIPLILFVKLGLLGVDIFFVISGFLITGLLICDLDSKIRIKRFYLRRIFKIIPPYFCALLGGFLILILFQSSPIYLYEVNTLPNGTAHFLKTKTEIRADFSLLLKYFFFNQNYSQHLFSLGHTWSIAVEENFYLAYPLVLWLITLLTKDLNCRRKILIVTLVLFILLVNVYRYWCQVHLSISPYQTTLYRIDSLMFGCLLRIFEPALKSIPAKKTKILAPVFLFISVLLYLSLFILLYSFMFKTRSNFNPSGFVTTLRTPFIFTTSYLAPGFMIGSALLGFKPLLKILSNKLMVEIGKNSYGIYLWHYIIILPFVLLQQWIPTPIVILLYFFSTLFVGYLSTITIERYSLNLRKKWAP